MSHEANPQTDADKNQSEIQSEVNDSLYFGITADFEGWFIKGKYDYIWRLKKLASSELKIMRDTEDNYEKLQNAAEMRLPLDGKTDIVTSSQVANASDDLAKLIFQTGLEDFVDEDWEALMNDNEIGRGDIADCSSALYLFLMRITTKRAAMRSLKPQPKGTPIISDISRAWRKSGNSMKQS